MTRCGAGIWRSVVAFAAAWWLVSGAPSLANSDTWDTAANGVWQIGANWFDNTTPGNSDAANFNQAGTYTVTFNGTPPAIQAMILQNSANVTFTSIGIFDPEIGTLRVNSTGGTQDLSVSGGANLSLGTSGGGVTPNKVLHLTVGDELRVSSGSTLNVRFGSDVITSGLNCLGQVNVSGSGSTLNSQASVIDGSLNVTAGGVVQDDFEVRVGSVAGIFSTATVAGPGSQWITDILSIANIGEGTLNITAGGKVQSRFGVVGNGPGSVGAVTVSGAGSQWNNSNTLNIGRFGQGTLNVTGGGSVSNTDGFLGPFIGSNGTATVTGGSWTMSGRLSVGGDAVDGLAGGSGTLNIQPAGTVSAVQGVVLFPDGLVRLQGGTLDTSAISYHQGIQGNQFLWTSGTLHVGTFNGNLTNQGGTLAPGHSAGSTTINGNYTQQAGAVLEIEIGGPLAVSEFDFVNLTGNALLDGELDLTLTGGFIPTPSQTFAILIANGGVLGAFDNVGNGERLATTDGLGSFVVNYGPGSPFGSTFVALSAFQAVLPGDYNGNGTVDAADYTAWRDHQGQSFTLINENPTAATPGVVDAEDYAFWKAHFGDTFGSGSGATALNDAAVPEPATLMLLSLLVGWCPHRRRAA